MPMFKQQRSLDENEIIRQKEKEEKERLKEEEKYSCKDILGTNFKIHRKHQVLPDIPKPRHFQTQVKASQTFNDMTRVYGYNIMALL